MRYLSKLPPMRRAACRLIPHWLAICAVTLPGIASAMALQIYQPPGVGFSVIVAEGRIESGDADRLRTLARTAARDAEGLVALVLSSPGGNVEAAFRMVDAMDAVRVHTIVPDNARCASACASIVFASGERRSILGSGKLGFHSCYRRDGKTYVSDSFCNEIIAANAMRRGISHAAINQFVADFGAQDMAWVGQATACRSLKGLCKPGRLEERPESSHALARSLDCSKLISVPSQLVCGDAELARVDKELANAYAQAMKSKNQARLRTDQRTWLRDQRNRCSDKACLLLAYRTRIDEVKRMPSRANAGD